MGKRCNNCNHKHTGNHSYLCTECREALRKTGVKASNELLAECLGGLAERKALKGPKRGMESTLPFTAIE